MVIEVRNGGDSYKNLYTYNPGHHYVHALVDKLIITDKETHIINTGTQLCTFTSTKICTHGCRNTHEYLRDTIMYIHEYKNLYSWNSEHSCFNRYLLL